MIGNENGNGRTQRYGIGDFEITVELLNVSMDDHFLHYSYF